MPLGGNFRISGRQTLTAGLDLPAAAMRTVCTMVTITDDGLPLVSVFTEPPVFFCALNAYHRGRNVTIFGRVPLCGQGRIYREKVIFTGEQAVDKRRVAIRTAAALVAAEDRGLPFVALRALPPKHFAVAGTYLRRGKVSVFNWMPLGSNFRIHGEKIIFAGDQAVEAWWVAAWATGASFAIDNTGLPFMTFRALPPNNFIAAGSNGLRCEVTVLGRMPLGCKIGE